MDGTLLTPEKKITLHTKTVIKMALNMGISILIVTGRPAGFAKAYIKEIDPRIQIIGFNGAQIDINNTMHLHPIPSGITTRILEITDFYQLHTYAKAANTIYTNQPWSPTFCYDKLTASLKPRYQIKSHCNLQSLTRVFHGKNPAILKVLAYHEDINLVQSARAKIEKLPAELFDCGKDNFEAIAAGISKGSAIEQASTLINIPLSQIGCIGDGSNDIPMFNKCAIKVAMGNAEPELKQIADYITESNEHEGAAKAIEFLIGR